MNQHENSINRFYSLDILRGVAALSVVFWHWQHFFFSGTKPGTFDVLRLPLSEWLYILYTKGWLAVDLFFSLSGFIFYWLYSKRVAEGAITPGNFALLRFSRLYPLHFATLLFVALCQVWLMKSSGLYFVYPNNDAAHFLLNLFFASSWGVERSASFNGPIWSVSVEVLLYVLFFVCCRLLPVRIIVLTLVSLTGYFVVQKYYSPIGRGIGSFFLGGCVFLFYQAIITSHYTNAATKWVTYLMVGAWAATLTVILKGLDLTSLSAHSIPFLWRFGISFQWCIQKWPVIVLFPLTILALALLETRRGSLGKRVSFLGDISYSSYLLHFPLQILFYVAVARFATSNSVFYAPWFMGLYFAVLILVCLGSYRYLEVPAQRIIRQSGIGRRFNGRSADACR
jgi:peptidoglycan/LPS O-acetylase OafA/YrhL